MPLVWMVSVSFMAPGEAAAFPPPLFPSEPTLENYRTLFGTYGIGRYLANSVLVSTLATILALLFVVPAGYAFAKLRFTGREAVFQALVAAMVVPGQIGMLPLFLELKAMGLVNSYAGALVPWLAGIFGIFLVRQFCLSIPTELLEAARIDGASEGLILRQIVLPALKPVLITLALFIFLGSWNDFMWPLIVLADQDLYTLPVALAALSREHVQDNELMMAGSVVTVLPVLVLFLALQRHYLERAARRERQGMRRLAILAALAAGRRRAARCSAMRWTAPRAWPAEGSDGVTASSRSVPGVSGQAVEMRYDFGGVSGYAFMRRKADVTLPRNYEIRFRMRGTGGRNDLQMKLTNGDNVWWKVWRNARPPAEWQEVVVPAGEIGFAWGPTDRQDAAPRRRDRVRRRAQPRWRGGDAGHRRLAHRPAARRADGPAAGREQAQRRHRRARQGEPARRLPARLHRRAALLDAGRIGRRQGRRADRRGCRDRARQGQLFDRPGAWSTAASASTGPMSRAQQALVDRRLPMPSVRWTDAGHCARHDAARRPRRARRLCRLTR